MFTDLYDLIRRRQQERKRIQVWELTCSLDFNDHLTVVPDGPIPEDRKPMEGFMRDPSVRAYRFARSV